MVFSDRNILNGLAVRKSREKLKTVAIIVARMESTRLPGKAMLPILGRPMIERMIERVRHSRYVTQIIIATTELASDDVLAALAKRLGVECFRGSVDDVLKRIHAAAATVDAELLVELLGDNPLVHSDLIDDVIDFYHANQCDYAASVTTEYPHAGPKIATFPIGIRVQVFTPAVLDQCQQLASTSYHLENSTTYIYEHPEKFKLGYFEAKGKWTELNRSELTFAVNYQQNLDLVSQLFELCYPRDANFSLSAMLQVLDETPWLASLARIPSDGNRL